jgi:hypothetical protein
MTPADKLRQLDQQATPAPWSQGMVGDRLIEEVDYAAAFGFIKIDNSDDGVAGVNDAKLIAEVRNCLPELADLVGVIDGHAQMHVGRSVWSEDEDDTDNSKCAASCRGCKIEAAYNALAEKLGTDHE